MKPSRRACQDDETQPGPPPAVRPRDSMADTVRPQRKERNERQACEAAVNVGGAQCSPRCPRGRRPSKPWTESATAAASPRPRRAAARPLHAPSLPTRHDSRRRVNRLQPQTSPANQEWRVALGREELTPKENRAAATRANRLYLREGPTVFTSAQGRKSDRRIHASSLGESGPQGAPCRRTAREYRGRFGRGIPKRGGALARIPLSVGG